MNKQVEAIRAEVERRLNEITIKVGEARPRLQGKRQAYLDVLGIIDSLPEEKPEDFNDAFDKYMKEEWSHGTQLNDIACHFYELGQQSKIKPSKGLDVTDFCKAEAFKDGDKVKVIIAKEDEQ